MNTALVILLDLGRFKAFRLEKSPLFSTPRLTQLEDRETAVERRLSEELSDQAGQFGKGARSFAAVNDMANGERHNIDLEFRRRAIKDFARFATDLSRREQTDAVYLAAASEINQQVLDALDETVRNRIEKNVKANLTRLNNNEIVEHFCGKKGKE
jgi:hypothetical protein